MIEFAFVVVLLIALLYGIITLRTDPRGTVNGDPSCCGRGTAASSPRRGVIGPLADLRRRRGRRPDVGLDGQGDVRHLSTTITCVATETPCPSNANNKCLKVTVSYNYASSPLFPEMPGTRRHHALDHLVDQHAADLESELLR